MSTILSDLFDYPKDVIPCSLSVLFYTINFVYLFAYADKMYESLSQMYEKDKYGCCILYGCSHSLLNYYYKSIYTTNDNSHQIEITNNNFSMIRAFKSLSCAAIFTLNTIGFSDENRIEVLCHFIAVGFLLSAEIFLEKQRGDKKEKKD